jgi:SAM-dependent methyltransferase
MMKSILEWMVAARQKYQAPAGRVLEVGSRDINGSPREVFGDSQLYLGIDAVQGKGVDIAVDAELFLEFSLWPWADTVVCCEVLEHVVRPWNLVEGMRRQLKPGGWLWISTPTYGFPLHRFPLDCYRFGEDAYRQWLYAGMDLVDLAHVKDELGQPAIVAVGRSKVPI